MEWLFNMYTDINTNSTANDHIIPSRFKEGTITCRVDDGVVMEEVHRGCSIADATAHRSLCRSGIEEIACGY